MPLSLALKIRAATDALAAASIDGAATDARLLIAHCLGIDRAQMLSDGARLLTSAEEAAIDAAIVRRVKHEPVSRIIGSREFWGLGFALNEATLDPRADSETLIEAALKLAPHARRILDLGTGSGCLLLALLHEMPQATGIGIDLSPRAIEQAAQNAKNLNLANRAVFQQGSWLENVGEKFDLIISNPPYITSGDINKLMPDVRDYDPLLALDGGFDGLAPYQHLIPQLPKYLNKNGLAIFEFGVGQATHVAALFQEAGFIKIISHKDLGRHERCISAHIP